MLRSRHPVVASRISDQAWIVEIWDLQQDDIEVIRVLWGILVFV
jgi:hypothetical protein